MIFIPLITLTILFSSCFRNNTKVSRNESPDIVDMLVEAYNKGDWGKILSICDTVYNEDDPKNVAIIYSEALAATRCYDEAIAVPEGRFPKAPIITTYY